MECTLCGVWLEAVKDPAKAFEVEIARARPQVDWMLEGFYHFFIVCLLASVLLMFGTLVDPRLRASFESSGFGGYAFILAGPVMLSAVIIFFAILALSCIGVSSWLLGGTSDLIKLSYFYTFCLPSLIFVLISLYHLIIGLAGVGDGLEFYLATGSFLVACWGLYMLTHAIRVSLRLSLRRAFVAWAVPLVIVSGLIIYFCVPLLH